MIVVEPYNIIDGMLTSSNIPEPDTARGEIVWSAYTAAIGDLRIVLATRLVYRAAAITTDDPVTGAAKSTPTWTVVGYTNRYRMFDQVNSSQSVKTSPLIVEITSPKGFNSAAIFNATGVTSVRYQVHSSTGALVYDRTIDAIDNSARVDYWHYFFEPVRQRYEFFVTDIPRSADSKLTCTVTGDSTVSVGTLVIGVAQSLGVTCYGSSFRVVNLSKPVENEFGDLVLTVRPNYKLVDYDVRVDKGDLNFAYNKLKQLINKPCVWSGTGDDEDATTVYGYHVDSQINIDQPSLCTATFKVRELV